MQHKFRQPFYIYKISLNHFIIIITIVFLESIILVTEVVVKDYNNSIIELFFIISLGVCYFIPVIKYNKNAITFTYILFNLYIFYLSQFYGEISMVHFFYIPIALTTILVFNYKKDRKYFFICITTTIFLFLTNVFSNYQLFNYRQDIEVAKTTRTRIFIYMVCYTVIIIYIILRKNQFIYKLHHENEVKLKIINSNQISTDSEEFKNFIIEVKSNSNGFILDFNKYFPLFISNLTQIAPTIVASEIEICAMLKLNFTTKEIAIATKSTISAINNKKARIRKKLNIPSEIELNTWFINF